MTYRDPIASLAPVPIIVSLGGNEYEIPAYPALDWLRILLRENFSTLDIVPGLLSPEAREAIEDQMDEGLLTWSEINDTAMDAISVASGRDWWFTIRFIAIARASWDVVGGVLARLRIDAREVTLANWVDAAYHICREVIVSGKEGQQNLVRFTSELEAPPPNIDGSFDEELEALAFERAVRMG